MKRLLSLDELDVLISLVEDQIPNQKYEHLLAYLREARHNRYGDGSLYALSWAGAVCLQCLQSEF